MQVRFIGWKPDAEVYGEAAGITFGRRVLDLVITYGGDGTYIWEVDDGCDSIATGTSGTVEGGKRACENAARRSLIGAA